MAKVLNKDELVVALGLKKTMGVTAVLLLAGGADKLNNWDEIVKSMQPKDGPAGESTPREVTILKDIEGNQLGRKCSVTGLWFPTDRFFKSGTLIKEADGAKNKLYSESKKMESDAKALLVEAREISDPMEKVAKFEEYDTALESAQKHRATEIAVVPKWTKGSFESIEALAKNLKVEVNPVKEEDTDSEAPAAE